MHDTAKVETRSETEKFEGNVITEPGPDLISDEAWNAALTLWIDRHVRNSPIAAVVEAWNCLGAALPHLKVYLNQQAALPPSKE
jgi:hypothetical protein